MWYDPVIGNVLATNNDFAEMCLHACCIGQDCRRKWMKRGLI